MFFPDHGACSASPLCNFWGRYTCQASCIWRESPAFYFNFTQKFPYILYKFTHFRFSCSPYISLNCYLLELGSYVPFCFLLKYEKLVKYPCDFSCENLYKHSMNALSNGLAFFLNLSNAARSLILFKHVWRLARIANLRLATSRLTNIFGNGTIYRHDKKLKCRSQEQVSKCQKPSAPEPEEIVRRTLCLSWSPLFISVSPSGS